MLQGLHRSLAAGLIRQTDACKEPGDWRSDWRLRKVRSQMADFQSIVNAASVSPPSSDDDQSDKPSSTGNGGKDKSLETARN